MWSVMKEILGKMHQHDKSKLPRKRFVVKKYSTLETETNFSQKLVHHFQDRFFLQ